MTSRSVAQSPADQATDEVRFILANVIRNSRSAPGAGLLAIATIFGELVAAANAGDFDKIGKIALRVLKLWGPEALNPQSEISQSVVGESYDQARDIIWKHVVDCAAATRGGKRPSSREFLRGFTRFLAGGKSVGRPKVADPIDVRVVYYRYFYRVSRAKNLLGRRRPTAALRREVSRASGLTEDQLDEVVYRDNDGRWHRFTAKQAARLLTSRELGIEVTTVSKHLTPSGLTK